MLFSWQRWKNKTKRQKQYGPCYSRSFCQTIAFCGVRKEEASSFHGSSRKDSQGRWWLLRWWYSNHVSINLIFPHWPWVILSCWTLVISLCFQTRVAFCEIHIPPPSLFFETLAPFLFISGFIPCSSSLMGLQIYYCKSIFIFYNLGDGCYL